MTTTSAPAHNVNPASDVHLDAGCQKGQPCRVWADRVHQEEPGTVAQDLTASNAVPEGAAHALQEMHPDPFVQAATWRLFREAPGLLDAHVWVRLHVAIGTSAQDLLDGLQARRGGTA